MTPCEPTTEKEAETAPKRPRLFSAREFRKQLQAADNKTDCLLRFGQVLSETNAHHVVCEYLEAGGSCLELLQLLEVGVAPSFVFQTVTEVLLVISANLPQSRAAAQDACRYLLNSHVTLVNKMLGLSSSGADRKTVLKLLTVVVTLSTTLAKDVLLKVNFNQANVDLLTKNTNESEDVRYFFVRFLTAFVVDGQYPTLMVLLEKKGLLVSAVKGLQFDDADCVCMVMAALKLHVLENPFVSKTTKMVTFNTQVVRSIVNLYNWKGKGHAPDAAKKKNVSAEIDQLQKSKVSQTVHDFLLTLCTSQKHGVVFRDKTLGLSGKHQNPLMYTVLESLERPWEHSFAGELVVKIVGACPDLARKLWGDLKPYLEPRETTKWLGVLKFCRRVLEELQPSCVEFCVRELTATQLVQVVQFLVAPTPIIKTLIPTNLNSQTLKYCVLQLLVDFLKSLNSYATAAEKWLKPDDYTHYRHLLAEHIERNFPDVQIILNDWELRDSETFVEYTQSDYLKVAFELLELYKKLAPNTLDLLNESLNLAEFFRKILQTSQNAREIFVKAAGLMVALDATVFPPASEMFAFVVPILLQFYHANRDENSRTALYEIFKNTSIFFGCENEISVWIDSVLNLKHLDETLAVFIVEIFKCAYKTSDLEVDGEFCEEFDLESVKTALAEIIEGKKAEVAVKHGGLSRVITAAIENFADFRSKSVVSYLNCAVVLLLRLQTKREVLHSLVAPSGVFSENIVNYISGNANDLSGAKGKLLKKVDEFLKAFFAKDFESYLNAQFDFYPEFDLNLLQLAIFHFANALTSKTLANNCLLFVKHLNAETKHLEAVLSHPAFLDNFKILNSNHKICVDFVTNLVKMSQSKDKLEVFLKAYRQKIESSVFKALRRLAKGKEVEGFEGLLGVLEVFGLEREQCAKILENVGGLEKTYKLLVFSLGSFCQLSEEGQNFVPLAGSVVKNLSNTLAAWNKQQNNTAEFAENFRKYLELFPQNLSDVSEDLFESILTKTEFCKENSVLAALLFKNSEHQHNVLTTNIASVCSKKLLLLLLLEKLDFDNSQLTAAIFANFKPVISKILQKPQKAGQYFEKHHNGLCKLLEAQFPKEEVAPFVQKVHKFDVSEVFHARMLSVLFLKDGGNESNALLTLAHLALSLMKRIAKETDEESWAKLENIVEVASKFLDKTQTLSLEVLLQNESFQLFCMLCLKFGISSKAYLLSLLTKLLKIANFTQQHAADLLEMIGSHSEFLELVLSGESPKKQELLSLILLLCETHSQILQKNHVPVFLAAYRATLAPSDRALLKLLKLCEQNAPVTSFYDFKPFLWGAAAAGHYSVRADVNTALWRQPRLGDVLNLLQEPLVLNTIKHFGGDVDEKERVYDLEFFLPLFTHLLAPENPAPTYLFTKSGAMALTVLALGSDKEEVRNAAAFVLYRFNHHQEARQSGKDNVLWLRYVEAICKGAAALDDHKLNTFTAIFFARVSLTLTQPYHVMYVPLSNYLVAKSSLNLNAIPELYTLLHSSDVNFKEHRTFILNLLRDGMKTREDFEVALRGMAFKLCMELYNSCLGDDATLLLILGVVRNATRISYAVTLLCSSYGLLSWLYQKLRGLLSGEDVNRFLPVFVDILRNILKSLEDSKEIDYVAYIIAHILDRHLNFVTGESLLLAVLDAVSLTFAKNSQFLNEARLKNIIEHVGDKQCRYYVQYGAKFVDVPQKTGSNVVGDHVRRITLDYLKLNCK